MNEAIVCLLLETTHLYPLTSCKLLIFFFLLICGYYLHMVWTLCAIYYIHMVNILSQSVTLSKSLRSFIFIKLLNHYEFVYFSCFFSWIFIQG